MPLGDRFRRRKRRLVRSGDRFTSDELARDEIELETVPPARKTDEERAEPWAMDGSKADPGARERLLAYREFLAGLEASRGDS